MDERRLTAIFAIGENGQPKTSTGYVIASRLVLTAAHAVNLEGQVEAQFINQETPMPCAVIWDGSEDDLDAALLEVDAAYWPPDAPEEPVRLGRLATLSPRTPAETIGFPAAQRDLDSELETAHVYGHINPGDKLLSGRWVLSVDGTPPENLGSSPWTGISGAPLFSGDLLCGVVVVDPPHWRHGKLDAVQAHRLLQNDRFRTLLGDRLGYSPVAEAVELEPLMEPAILSRPPRSLPELLRPQAESVRFLGREEQIAEFRAWCQGDGVLARLLTGPGGQGKTRFARELARTLAAEGWVVGQLRDSASSESYHLLGKIRPRLLLIMDYADTRPGSVAEVMRALEDEGNNGTVRILLIARSAGEWWNQLPTSTSAYVSLLSGAAVVQLTAVADDPPTRQSLYRAALLDLARGLRRLPSYADVDWESFARTLPATDLSDNRLSSALTLQLRALTDLLTALPEAQSGQAGKTLEALFLEHEKRYWANTARRSPLLRELNSDELGNAVAAATLTRVSGKERATELLAKVPGLGGTEERVRSALAAWLSDLYPASNESYWGALEPDRIGEYHVSARIADEPTFLQEFLPILGTAEAERALTVLARAGAQPVCPYPELLDKVAALVTAHPERLAVPAAFVATQSENPDFLIAGLTDLAARSDLPVDLLENLTTAFPPQTASLAGPALKVARCLVRANRRAVRRAWFPAASQQRETAAHPASCDSAPPPRAADRIINARADLARAYHNYAHRLMSLGRWNEAIAAGGQAIRLYRRLEREHRDLYRPFLASSLDNQAIALSSTGRLGDALKVSQQARAVHRKLAEDDSDPHLLGLARSLSSAAGIFAALDGHQAALGTSTEAVTILSRLANRKLGYLSELASALHNQATHYAEGAWFEKAEETSRRAVAIRRRLAVQRPDAVLPGLAHSLHNFSIDLAASDKRASSLKIIDESISVYLRLASDRGSSYLPHLANALNTKTILCRNSIKGRDAVISSARAVLIYMHLTRDRPAEFQADLAVALRNHEWARIEVGSLQRTRWDAVIERAGELVDRDLPENPRFATGNAFDEGAEIRRLGLELIDANTLDIERARSELDAALKRHQVTPHYRWPGTPSEEADKVPPSRWRSFITKTSGIVRRARLKQNTVSQLPKYPIEALDDAYIRQVEMLTYLRRGCAELSTTRKRAELQLNYFKKSNSTDLIQQEPSAKIMPDPTVDKAVAKQQELDKQHRALQADEKMLSLTLTRIAQKCDSFRTQKETLKAAYSAADAADRIAVAYTGYTVSIGDIGMRMRRAQDRATHMQDRGDPTGNLRISRVFDEVSGSRYEETQTELDRFPSEIDAELERGINAELERLKEELENRNRLDGS